jgi:hypothetical protein
MTEMRGRLHIRYHEEVSKNKRVKRPQITEDVIMAYKLRPIELGGQMRYCM